MSERETSVELARVLVEAGESATVVEWVEGELRLVYDEATRVLASAESSAVERERAFGIRTSVGRLLSDLSRLDAETKDE